MSDVDRLFSEYVREHRAGGEADPGVFLSQASPEHRRKLAALIDSYLAAAPRIEFDPGQFRGSSAERTVDELERVLGGRAGLWPALLPRLRHRAGLKRTQLVERLAATLGAVDRASKVGDYYHRMEQGTLQAEGVSDRVLDALGQIVGETAQALREAGRARGEGAAPAGPQPAFARRAYTEASAATPAAASPTDAPEWDEVDELFRGAESSGSGP